MSARFNVLLYLNMFLILVSCSSAGTLTPVLDSPGTYSLETRTGIQEVDHVIAALATGDREELESVLKYTTAPCTTLEGLGGPPKCREGEADRTPVEALPFVGSEGSFIRKDEIGNWTGLDAAVLFAIYRISEEGVKEPYYPRGEYAIVILSKKNGSAVTLRIDDGGIVRMDYPMNESLQVLKSIVEQDASEVILAMDIR